MKELRKKTFKNGVVYCLQLEDGFLVETTDTFLPYYTKDAIGRHQNKLDNNELGDRTERWMIGVSTNHPEEHDIVKYTAISWYREEFVGGVDLGRNYMHAKYKFFELVVNKNIFWK